MGNIRLIIAYEGTRYCGWQSQSGELSVQGMLEEAFTRMTGLKTRFIAAGRTDAGVHALGQVVAFMNSSRHGPGELREGLNALLPEDIAVLQAENAPENFNPRKDARGKHYRYTIHNSNVRPVLERNFQWYLRKTIDLDNMKKASAALLGEHDFGAFRGSGSAAKSSIRRIDWLGWRRKESRMTLDIWGRGFLKQMVRNIVGTCVEVGRGALSPEDVVSILESRDRRLAGPTAPAKGLCLMKVFFKEEEYQDALASANQDH